MIINIPFPAYIAALLTYPGLSEERLAKELKEQHPTNTTSDSEAMAALLMFTRNQKC